MNQIKNISKNTRKIKHIAHDESIRIHIHAIPVDGIVYRYACNPGILLQAFTAVGNNVNRIQEN